MTGKYHEVKTLLTDLDIDVLLISETRQTVHPSFVGYKQVERAADRGPGGGIRRGMVLYFRDTITTLPTIDPPSDPGETLYLTLNLKTQAGQALTILGLYHPPDAPFDINALKDRLSNSNPNLIMGDFNAHDPTIDIRTSDPNQAGQAVTHLIEDEGMTLLNTEEPTHDRGHRLDLMLADQDIADRMTRFDINDRVQSDHATIITTLDFDGPGRQTRWVRDWRNIDLTTYQDRIEEAIGPNRDLSTPDIIEDEIDKLTKAISDVIDDMVPLRLQRERQSWLSDLTLSLIRKRAWLRRRLRRHGLGDLRPEINKLTRLIQHHIRHDKKDLHRTLEQQLTTIRTGSGEFWKKLKSILGQFKGTRPITLQVDNNTITDDRAVADIMATHLSNVSTRPAEPAASDLKDETILTHQNENPHIYGPAFDQDAFDNQELTMDQDKLDLLKDIEPAEIEWAIRKTANKSPGEDDISQKPIFHAGWALWTRLQNIFSACLKIGYYPEIWKRARVIVLGKPGKDPRNPASYRPISLLRVSGKLFEKILNKRIVTYLEARNILSESQMGFRRERGVDDQVTLVAHKIAEALNRRRKTCLVTFDVEKAFDKTWTEGLTYKIKMMDIFPDRLTRLLNDYLKERRFQVRINTRLSETKTTTAGTPQGSILSPTLFLLLVNDLPEHVDTARVKSNQFADDTALIGSERKESKLKREMQEAIKRLETWATRWRIKINPTKSQYLIIGRTHHDHDFALTLYDQQIERVTKLRYLGVIFNKTGNATDHVRHILTKAAPMTKKLTQLGRNQTLPPDLVLRLFQTYVRPILEFACPAWMTYIPRRLKNRLEAQQRKTLKAAIGLPVWTPTRILTEELTAIGLEIKTLEERRHEIGRAFLRRTKTQDTLLTRNNPHRCSYVNYPAYAILQGQQLDPE